MAASHLGCRSDRRDSTCNASARACVVPKMLAVTNAPTQAEQSALSLPHVAAEMEGKGVMILQDTVRAARVCSCPHKLDV